MNQFQNNAHESILRILSETGIPSRMLAIETIEYPFKRTMQLSQELSVSICFDIGHVIGGFSGPVDVFDELEQSIPNIREIHLHDDPRQGLDNKVGYGKDHQALGLGDLDVAKFLDRLEQYNLNGPIIFELGLDEAIQSIEFIHSIQSNFADRSV